MTHLDELIVSSSSESLLLVSSSSSSSSSYYSFHDYHVLMVMVAWLVGVVVVAFWYNSEHKRYTNNSSTKKNNNTSKKNNNTKHPGVSHATAHAIYKTNGSPNQETETKETEKKKEEKGEKGDGTDAKDEGNTELDVDPRRKWGNTFKRRTRAHWSRDARRAIETTSLQVGVKPVGSFSYLAHTYPSDIDLMETYVRCCSLNELRNSFIRDLQRTVRNLLKTPSNFLSDFKAGYDARFDMYVGQRRYNSEIGAYVDGFEARTLLENIDDLETQVTLTAREAEHARTLIRQAEESSKGTSRPQLKEWEKVVRWVRSNRVLRWSADEIFAGEKILASKKRILLEDAVIFGRSIVKLDTWMIVDGRYMEISNWFGLDEEMYVNGPRERVSGSLGEYLVQLRLEIASTASEEHWLKACKRAWSLAIAVHDLPTAAALAPLFSSLVAVLNQISADLKVAIAMIDKLAPTKQVPIKVLHSELTTLDARLRTFVAKSNRKFTEEEHKLIEKVHRDLARAQVVPLAATPEFTSQMEAIIAYISKYCDAVAKAHLAAINLDVVEWSTSAGSGTLMRGFSSSMPPDLLPVTNVD